MDGGHEPEEPSSAEACRGDGLQVLRELVEPRERRSDRYLQALPGGSHEGVEGMKWIVEVVERGAEEKVVKRIECGSSERMAERTERGVNINMNHDRFFTRLVEEAVCRP